MATIVRSREVVVGSRHAWRTPALITLAVALVRVPFLALPLRPDEAGYLLVASQWSPGSSTYGHYFLDRPPLLVMIFGVADELGGAVPLRLIGLAAAVAAVLLAYALGGTTSAAVAAVFVSTPLFDAQEIDGELLAIPFVLAGILLLVRSIRSSDPPEAYGAAAAAGICGAGAVLVKQNMIDVLVVAGVLLVGVLIRQGWRAAAPRAAAFASGGLGFTALALVIAAVHGTGPAALWDALVTFRAQAAAVISASANDATPARFRGMLIALAVSGAPLVAAAALAGFRRRSSEPDLRWAALALVAWEMVGAVLGGSFWLHYLLALTPGLVLLTAAARPVRWRPAAIAVAAVSTVVALVGMSLQHPDESGQEVAAYLRARSAPGDTMVVAFGQPQLVYDAGLSSPYQHLWSLSARVRDPHLDELTAVLEGPRPPRWVVVSGTALATWGIDTSAAQPVLDNLYEEVTSDGDWHVFEHR